MKIIETETYIKKHTKSNDNIQGNNIERGSMAIGLVKVPGSHLFKVEDNIYITNVDTDFILDITLEVWIRFDNSGRAVTVPDLYDLYCRAKDLEEEEIIQSAELGEIWRLLHYNRGISKRAFIDMQENLNAVLAKSSIQNN